jgi:beta-galactosidase
MGSAAALVALLLAAASAQNSGGYITYDQVAGSPYTVSWDERSFIINGSRTLLLGGSFHYPRASPADWVTAFQNARDDGLNHIQTYAFWSLRLHGVLLILAGTSMSLSKGSSTSLAVPISLISLSWQDTPASLSTSVSVLMFVQVCDKDATLFHYTEWNLGGLPLWLKYIEGMEPRTSSTQWEQYMQSFVTLIADMIEPYLARNGGPVILSQVWGFFRICVFIWRLRTSTTVETRNMWIGAAT